MVFENFSNEARIWLYQSNRELTKVEQTYLEKQLRIFVDQWAAHGKKLTADSAILDEYRLAICAEGNVEASGCSIDASVRFMKEMGAELGVNFFDRMKILAEIDGEKKLVPFSSLKENPEMTIFHPSVLTIKDLREKSKLKVSQYFAS